MAAAIASAIAYGCVSASPPAEARGDRAFRELMLAFRAELWDQEMVVDLDPRLVPPGLVLDTAFVGSAPEELERRASIGRELGMERGDVAAIEECLPFMGFRLDPIPDSIMSRMRTCSERFPHPVVVASIPSVEGGTVVRRLFMTGNAGFHVWKAEFTPEGVLASFMLEQSSHD